MKKENDELFNLFRSRLEHVEAEIRNDFWKQLENDIPVVIRNRRRLTIQRFSAAASVLLILAGVSAAFWHFSPKDEIADAFQKMEVANVPKGVKKNDGIKEELPSIHAGVTKPAETISMPQPVEPVFEDIDDESFSFSFSMSLTVTEQAGETNRQLNNGNRLVGGMDDQNNNSEEPFRETTTPKQAKKTGKNSWSVGAFASANLINGKESKSGLQRFSDDFASEEDYANYTKVAENLSSQNPQTKVKHKLPISAGLSIKKQLTDKFSLESGVVYTQLNSELTGGKEDTYYQQDQTLHYLGIPLKANYTFFDSKHFDLYASAGGMVEKSISGTIKTDYYDAGKHTHFSKQSLSVDPLQLSLMAALGVQYKFNERLSVYAEPGLAYYFDDGSSVSTIRKEKPLNFNVLCGVRMTY